MVFVKKKTLLLISLVAAAIFTAIQISYFSEAYSPLQVLSDARSEAKRLLRFLTFYHYHCNVTLQGVNISDWPVCLDKEGDIDLESRLLKTAVSIGPSGEYDLERVLAQNLSFLVYIFTHRSIESSKVVLNNTQVFKTAVVANDPADFARVSYDTNTINNLLQIVKLQQLDILKVDNLADVLHSHEILYFLIKDHVLANVKQLHIAIHVDKVDDDYLYSWYRSLYNLFHLAQFRLYHTSASDPLCLQVTLMESCIYYLSWIKNPGPQSFILYPPAMDGSRVFEVERLVNYLETPAQICRDVLHVEIQRSSFLPICLDSFHHSNQDSCVIIILREKSYVNMLDSVPNTRCSVQILVTNSHHQEDSSIVFVREIGSRSKGVPIGERLGPSYLQANSIKILYIDTPNVFWKLITPILDSGVLWNIYQLVIDIKIWSSKSDKLPLSIHSKYSELKRIEAFHFKLHSKESLHLSNLDGDVLDVEKCCFRMSYINNKYKYRVK